jgi:hypothetical protein
VYDATRDVKAADRLTKDTRELQKNRLAPGVRASKWDILGSGQLYRAKMLDWLGVIGQLWFRHEQMNFEGDGNAPQVAVLRR